MWSVVAQFVRAGAILVLAAVVFVEAPQVGAEPPRHDPPRVLVIGDSIILGTHDGIAANLPGWDVIFDASVSRSTDAGLQSLAAHGTDFDVVVIALGANDGGTPGVFAPRVASLLDALGDVHRVIWLTINEARPYYAQTNAIIRDQVAGRPNASVGDWAAAIQPGDVGPDGLHLTGQGAANMSAWVADLVRDVNASTPVTTSSTSTTTTSTSTTSTTSTTTTSTSTTSTTTTTPSTPETTTSSVPAAEATAASSSGSGWLWVVAGLVVVVAAGAFVALRARRSSES